jgi:hypothetical protein
MIGTLLLALTLPQGAPDVRPVYVYPLTAAEFRAVCHLSARRDADRKLCDTDSYINYVWTPRKDECLGVSGGVFDATYLDCMKPMTIRFFTPKQQ